MSLSRTRPRSRQIGVGVLTALAAVGALAAAAPSAAAAPATKHASRDTRFYVPHPRRARSNRSRTWCARATCATPSASLAWSPRRRPCGSPAAHRPRSAGPCATPSRPRPGSTPSRSWSPTTSRSATARSTRRAAPRHRGLLRGLDPRLRRRHRRPHAVVLLEPDGLGIIPWTTRINGAKEWCQPADAERDRRERPVPRCSTTP